MMVNARLIAIKMPYLTKCNVYFTIMQKNVVHSSTAVTMENLNNVLKNFGVTCVQTHVAVSHTSSGYAALTHTNS